MKVIKLLAKYHNRERFDCGNEALNKFFRQTARQHIQKGISRTFVLVDYIVVRLRQGNPTPEVTCVGFCYRSTQPRGYL